MKTAVKVAINNLGIGGASVAVPTNYATMRALNDTATYAALVYKGDDAAYHNLFGKVS